MLARLHRTYYWPLMYADIATNVRFCPHCTRNRLGLIRRQKPMRLFPARQPLESVAIDLLGPLPKTKARDRFIIVMGDRFTKLPQVVPLKRTTGLYVTKAFVLHWVFKYCAPKEVLSDKGLQMASRIYQNTCLVLGTVKRSERRTARRRTPRSSASTLPLPRCYAVTSPTITITCTNRWSR